MLQPPLDPLPDPTFQRQCRNWITPQELIQIFHRLGLLLDHSQYLIDRFFMCVAQELFRDGFKGKISKLVLVEGNRPVEDGMCGDED